MTAEGSDQAVTGLRQPAPATAGRLGRHWLSILLLAVAVFVGLPWLAPVFMALGWTRPAELIYLIYSTQCHQLPQRSFFLFGERLMYSLAEVQAVWGESVNPVSLRAFIGNSATGWKVAWSDRMVYMYTAVILWGVAFFRPLRRRLRPLPLWGLLLLFMPMILDGGTHLLSDAISPLGIGFRETNRWLAVLTNHSFAATFYAGDALGSFNAWLRLISGVLFALGVVWFLFPRLERSFNHERPDSSHIG